MPTQVRVEQFEERFLDAVTVYFQMYVFKDSLYVWVGENPAYLSNMNVAFPTKLVRVLLELNRQKISLHFYKRYTIILFIKFCF